MTPSAEANPAAGRARGIDTDFVSDYSIAADDETRGLIATLASHLQGQPSHRPVMYAIKAFIAAWLDSSSRYYRDAALLTAVGEALSTLEQLQGHDGLFGGDNLASPPDSAFTVNDLADVHHLLGRYRDPATEPIRVRLAQIATRITPALISGGVHTPNHRWELSAALARIHRDWPDQAVQQRIDDWLAESVDITAEGMYSERSALYAAHVTNPSLIAIATLQQRPELLTVVETNLEAVIALTSADGFVETICSRRQDQQARFSLAPFAMALRRLAMVRHRSDFAWWSQAAIRAGWVEAAGARAEILLEPWLAEQACEPVVPLEPRVRHFPEMKLAVVHQERSRLVVYGGSDYAQTRRIRSGLANNPTFARFSVGEVHIDAIRLSRDFFGLGPFRASSLDRDGDQWVLREEVSAAYYGPLSPAHRDPAGAYQLSDEGRFSAAMSFAQRPAQELTLATVITVTPLPDGVELTITTQGPVTTADLHITLRPGGTLTGTRSMGQVAWVESPVTYHVGADQVIFTATGDLDDSTRLPRYHPGEEYTYLGGTDITDGKHLYVRLQVPGTAVVQMYSRKITHEETR